MKKLLTVLLLLFVALTATACGSKEPTPETVEETKFTIWHTFTEGQETLLNDLAREFEAAHEGVTIEVIGGYDYTTFESTVQDAVVNGVGPQLVFNYASFAANFDGYDLLLSFDDYWDLDYASLTTPGIVDEATGFSDGKIHAVPIQTTGPVLFYDAKVLEEVGKEVPTTWAEVSDVAKAIYEQTGKVGFAIDSKSDIAQILILQSHDGAYVDIDNNKVLWNDETTLEWVNWWSEGVKEGYFQLAPTTGNYNSSDINAGTLAMYIGSSAGIPYLDLSNIGGELGVARIPGIDADHMQTVVWNRGAVGFKGTEAQNKAVAEFVAYFIEQDQRWTKELNAYSPYFKTQEEAAYKEFVSQDLALIALGEQMADGVVIPTFNGSNNVRTELNNLFSACADPNFDAKAALETAAANSEAAMAD